MTWREIVHRNALVNITSTQGEATRLGGFGTFWCMINLAAFSPGGGGGRAGPPTPPARTKSRKNRGEGGDCQRICAKIG